jgi:hypothetical protein
MFIDPALAFAEYIKEDLTSVGLLNCSNSSSEAFYVSSNPELFSSSSKMFYNIKYYFISYTHIRARVSREKHGGYFL